MTREEARKAARVVLAYANGENIQIAHWGTEDWKPCVNPTFQFGNYRYRVQSEPKYRPFKNGDECFEEMKKHESFGWIKSKSSGTYMYISKVYNECIWVGSNHQYGYKSVLNKYTFVDGEPFGIKED